MLYFEAHTKQHELLAIPEARQCGLQHATVASMPLETGKAYLYGWAAVKFLTPDAAILALQRCGSQPEENCILPSCMKRMSLLMMSSSASTARSTPTTKLTVPP